MDLRTNYLGFSLDSPLVAGASPISSDISNIKKLEDAGAGAIVLHSLFEEQLKRDQIELHIAETQHSYSSAEAMTYFPDLESYRVGPEEYLEHIHLAKSAVGIPIIASLNGSCIGAWTNFAKNIEQAGADALELNIYSVQSDMTLPPSEIEAHYIDILRSIKSEIKIPVSVKLSPYFTNLPNFVKRMEEAGADAFTLFNRFYQPDIDLNELEITPKVQLSSSTDIRLPLTWIGILKHKIQADFAASGGVHTAEDVLKTMMVGANVSMLVSTLLIRGIDYLSVIKRDIIKWMETHEYVSIRQMQGSMSQQNVSDPSAFERAQYMKAITRYQFAK
jgi:dihydroorotate dehydrogenase (fumarate)